MYYLNECMLTHLDNWSIHLAVNVEVRLLIEWMANSASPLSHWQALMIQFVKDQQQVSYKETGVLYTYVHTVCRTCLIG